MKSSKTGLPRANATLAVIGLGYVGLPLAVEFGKVRKVIGFDISEPRIAALRAGRDGALEVEPEELAKAKRLIFTSSSTVINRHQHVLILNRP